MMRILLQDDAKSEEDSVARDKCCLQGVKKYIHYN